MAEGVLGHALAAAFTYFLTPTPESAQGPHPYTSPEPTNPIAETKVPSWNFFHNWYPTPPSTPFVVIGQPSSALATLIELANQFSPELLLMLIFCGVVGIIALILYLVVKSLLFIIRTARKYLFGTITPTQNDLSQLSDAARQVYALVQLQNPGLFAQSPVPINTPRRNRTSNNRRR